MALNLTPIAALRARLFAAQEEEANAILTVSNERIPKDTTTAEQSGRVVTGDDGTVYITYGKDDDHNPKTGQPSNSYIEPLHEDLAAHHDNGEAKFLQSAADEAQAGMAERIAMKAMVT